MGNKASSRKQLVGAKVSEWSSWPSAILMQSSTSCLECERIPSRKYRRKLLNNQREETLLAGKGLSKENGNSNYMYFHPCFDAQVLSEAIIEQSFAYVTTKF